MRRPACEHADQLQDALSSSSAAPDSQCSVRARCNFLLDAACQLFPVARRLLIQSFTSTRVGPLLRLQTLFAKRVRCSLPAPDQCDPQLWIKCVYRCSSSRSLQFHSCPTSPPLPSFETRFSRVASSHKPKSLLMCWRLQTTKSLLLSVLLAVIKVSEVDRGGCETISAASTAR